MDASLAWYEGTWFDSRGQEKFFVQRLYHRSNMGRIVEMAKRNLSGGDENRQRCTSACLSAARGHWHFTGGGTELVCTVILYVV